MKGALTQLANTSDCTEMAVCTLHLIEFCIDMIMIVFNMVRKETFLSYHFYFVIVSG